MTDELTPASLLRDEGERYRDNLVLGLVVAGETPPGASAAQALAALRRGRAGGWRRVREAHLAAHPRCLACGRDRNLEVHHLKPFHLFPDLELSEANLVTLCETGPAGANCHLLIGHGGSWHDYNPHAGRDAAALLVMVTNRVRG